MFKKRIALALLFCFVIIALPGTPLSLPHAASAHSLVSCSGRGCDGKDPATTGCSVNATHIGIIVHTWEDQTDYNDNQVWFSSLCQSNFGYISSYTGQPLVLVAIFRADQSGKFCNQGGCTVNGQACYGQNGCDFSDGELGINSGNARFYCAQGGHCYGALLPKGTKTWETDLMYSPTQAPNQEIQICQLPAGAPKFYCSAWH